MLHYHILILSFVSCLLSASTLISQCTVLLISRSLSALTFNLNTSKPSDADRISIVIIAFHSQISTEVTLIQPIDAVNISQLP